MGLLDYYRQFEDIDEEELNRERRARRAREKALALEQVPTVDLSGTEWPNFPNSEIMNAAIAAARGRVNGYPDRHASAIRARRSPSATRSIRSRSSSATAPPSCSSRPRCCSCATAASSSRRGRPTRSSR